MNSARLRLIKPQHKLDSQGSEDLKKQVLAIAGEQYSVWVIDMSHVEFIDSSGLGALVVAQKTAKKNGCRLVVSHLSDVTRMVFEITQLDRVFEIVDHFDNITADSQTLLSA